MTHKKVAVLMGGWSPEREVSLSSGKAAVLALTELGHEVVPIDVTRSIHTFMETLMLSQPEVVLNALHGSGGEDGVVQGILESLNLPYTHSGLSASSLAMNKVLSRRIFQSEGLKVPEWKLVCPTSFKEGHPYPPSYVLKPVSEGSSVGVQVIHEGDEVPDIHETWRYGPKVLVEKYIKGREIHVAVMGDKPIGAIEICPLTTAFYDYKAKYTEGHAKHLMPAPLPELAYNRVLALAQKAHHALGCRGVTRADFMYNEQEDEFYILEINTQPGMTPLSLVPEIAAYHGISFNQLIEWMIKEARCDQ